MRFTAIVLDYPSWKTLAACRARLRRERLCGLRRIGATPLPPPPTGRSRARQAARTTRARPCAPTLPTSGVYALSPLAVTRSMSRLPVALPSIGYRTLERNVHRCYPEWGSDLPTSVLELPVAIGKWIPRRRLRRRHHRGLRRSSGTRRRGPRSAGRLLPVSAKLTGSAIAETTAPAEHNER